MINLLGRKQSGLHYVAMSRLISHTGLQLRNFRKQDIVACSEVTKEYERLRTQARLPLKIPQLQQLGNHHFVITAINARSLHSNIDNIRADHNMLQSNLILATESWANRTDSDNHYRIPGFHMERRDNSSVSFEQRPHRGIVAYYKSCEFRVVHTTSHINCDIMCTTVTTEYLALNVIIVYRSPQLAMQAFLQLLHEGMQALPAANPCVILGDFNVDIKGMNADTALKLAYQDSEHHLKALVQFMFQANLTQMLSASTVDSGMQIDHVWSDLSSRLQHMSITPFVLEAFYSDHRPIGLQITSPE